MQNHVDLSGGANSNVHYESPASGLKDSVAGSLTGSLGSSMIKEVRGKLDRGLTEVRAHIQNSSSAIRAGSFLGGVSIVVVALLSVLNVFRMAYDSVSYLVNLYQLFFGLVTIFLEGKREWPGVARVQNIIYKEAHFLSVVNGRALFYLFLGSLFISQMQILQIIVGAYMAALGVLMLYSAGRKGFSTVNEMDSSLTQNLADSEASTDCP